MPQLPNEHTEAGPQAADWGKDLLDTGRFGARIVIGCLGLVEKWRNPQVSV